LIGPEVYLPQSTDDILEMAAAHPDRFIPFCNADALAMFRYCGQLGRPVLFHLQCSPLVLKSMAQDIYTWTEWYGGDMTTVETMCRECQDTNFIGHAPGFWREISGDADEIENTGTDSMGISA
jgi:predicted TIM-barrel fold metal-dependent hydrolase